MKKKFIVFTDLDDTLLDKNYSPDQAMHTIKKLNKLKIPIIFCSAKTKAEQEILRKNLRIYHPFIVENGSAIYIPKKYFDKSVGNMKCKYERIIIGIASKEIYKEINKLRKKYKIISYNNLTIKEISEITGHDIKAAKRAKMREFGETIIKADKNALRELKKKFNVVKGGRFIQVFGKGADKGKAVKILINLYKKNSNQQIISLGLGNSYNDKPMLKVVDFPIIVKNPDNTWAKLNIKNIIKINDIGPKGWAKAIRKFIL
ncbi:MAG TPA: HAD-IIB family hydrolase [Candidatus Aenigmarchaeota archaeon]|nr:HAD-IIB family hydrolase [Candidatus Aenigmarchaeota archaeon]